jgi:hypothetical protein
MKAFQRSIAQRLGFVNLIDGMGYFHSMGLQMMDMWNEMKISSGCWWEELITWQTAAYIHPKIAGIKLCCKNLGKTFDERLAFISAYSAEIAMRSPCSTSFWPSISQKTINREKMWKSNSLSSAMLCGSQWFLLLACAYRSKIKRYG